MYGCSLKLPIDIVDPPQEDHSLNISSYADRLRQHMQDLHPPTTREPKVPSYVDSKLAESTHVFVKNDSKTGLLPNYKGPFKVLERGNKFFKIQTDRKIDTVSVDRLKHARLPVEDLSEPTEEVVLPPQHPSIPFTAPPTTSPAVPLQQTPAQRRSSIPRLSTGTSSGSTVPVPAARGRTKRVTYEDVNTRIPPIKLTRTGRITKPPSRFRL